jgi:hypothetical protein
MKQVIAQIVIAVVLILVIGFFVWMFRSRRASRAAGATALEALARDLETTYSPSSWTSLTGKFRGRRCAIHEMRRPGSDDAERYAHLEIACAARAPFQVQRSQASPTGTEPADRVRVGERDFDLQLWVRTTDAERARRILTPDLQQRLLDWFQHGRVDLIWWKNGQLLIDGGYGFREDWQVDLARQLLQAGVEIAEGLE